MSSGGADEPGLDPVAAVQAWRARGAAAADPVGFRIIEALARRASAQQGEARWLLLRRLEQLLARQAAAKRPAPSDGTAGDERAAHGARAAPAGTAAPAAPAGTAELAAPSGLSSLAALSDLVDRLGRSPASPVMPSSSNSSPSSPRSGAPRQAATVAAARPSRTAPPVPLKAVTAFKGTWSRLRAEQRLRQALAQVPAMAGPLNSSHLVHRALQAMHELSPEYLDAFMSQVDTLLALEQALGAGEPAPRAAPRAEGRRAGAKPARKA